VGAVVARGEAEIGFQQVSELLPIRGIDYVGPLPSEVQRVSVFSAGIAAGAKYLDAAGAFIRFLASPESARVITRTGLEPIASQEVPPKKAIETPYHVPGLNAIQAINPSALQTADQLGTTFLAGGLVAADDRLAITVNLARSWVLPR
jgi:ABC-type Fe3+ transport system substrate-binding protein